MKKNYTEMTEIWSIVSQMNKTRTAAQDKTKELQNENKRCLQGKKLGEKS